MDINSENLASYEASSFCINATELIFDQHGVDANGNPLFKISKQDFPALMHEWWHYIQDISTTSAQHGMYMLMRDIAGISKITCSKQNEVITIPLPTNEYGKHMNYNRNFYNYYCAYENPKDCKAITAPPVIDVESLPLDGSMYNHAKCYLELDGKKTSFGLFALQELNAFYAQKIAEGYLPNQILNRTADSCYGYPYHVGDFLFDYYKIKADLRTKFVISTLCLDCIQAPVVFLKVAEAFSNRELNYPENRELILETINRVKQTHSHPNIEAFCEWKKDYDNWSDESNGHEYIAKALQWYWKTIGCTRMAMLEHGDDILPKVFSENINALNKLYEAFPAPLIKQDGEVKGTSLDNNPKNSHTVEDFSCALAIWSLRRVYLVLTATRLKDLNEHSTCPLYAKCPYKKQVDDDYGCQRAPWSVIQNMTKAECPYAAAAHTMGLWQNTLDIDFNNLD